MDFGMLVTYFCTCTFISVLYFKKTKFPSICNCMEIWVARKHTTGRIMEPNILSSAPVNITGKADSRSGMDLTGDQTFRDVNIVLEESHPCCVLCCKVTCVARIRCKDISESDCANSWTVLACRLPKMEVMCVYVLSGS